MTCYALLHIQFYRKMCKYMLRMSEVRLSSRRVCQHAKLRNPISSLMPIGFSAGCGSAEIIHQPAAAGKIVTCRNSSQILLSFDGMVKTVSAGMSIS